MTRTRRTVLGWATGAAAITVLMLLITAPIALADGGWVYSGSFGTPGSGAGQFNGDVGQIVCDGHGNLYIADRNTNRIEKWSTSGAYVTSFGSTGTGNGQFTQPFGVAIGPDGYLSVTEEGGTRVQKLTASGAWQRSITGFSDPLGVAVDSGGATWVCDTSTGMVSKFDFSGNLLLHADPTPSGEQLAWPSGIAVDGADDLYVADTNNDRIVVFDHNGTYLRQFPATSPWVVAVDPAGHVFVAGHTSGITEFNRFGLELRSFGLGRFSGAIYGLAVDGRGDLWATDSWGSKVEEYTWDEPAITTDADGDWHSHTTVVHLSSTDTVSGVKSLEYCADGATWRQDDSFALMPMADHSGDGVYVVQVRATSNDGNTATASFRVKIDTRAPTVTASGPIDEWVRSPQELWFSASDMGSGVGGIEYTIDGGPPLPVGDDGSITVSGDGHHTVTYWATDNCIDIPNASALQTADIYLDSVAPKVATLNNVVVTRGKKASFRFTVNDSLSDHCWVELRIAKKGKVVKLIEVGSRPSETARQTMSWTCKLARGSYTWRATAYDMAGNASRGALKKLTVK